MLYQYFSNTRVIIFEILRFYFNFNKVEALYTRMFWVSTVFREKSNEIGLLQIHGKYFGENGSYVIWRRQK